MSGFRFGQDLVYQLRTIWYKVSSFEIVFQHCCETSLPFIRF